MPLLRGSGYGDLYIKIITEVPSNLNSKQKELLEEFRKIESEKSSPIIKNFFEKSEKILEEFIIYYGNARYYVCYFSIGSFIFSHYPHF